MTRADTWRHGQQRDNSVKETTPWQHCHSRHNELFIGHSDTATSGPRPLNTCHRFSFSFQTPDNYVHSTLSIPLKGDPLSFQRKPFDTSDVISTLERSSVRSWSRYQVMRTAAIFAAEGRPFLWLQSVSSPQPPGRWRPCCQHAACCHLR